MDLIFTAFATAAGYRESSNANRGSEDYYRGVVVTLASARAQNPGCSVALVTNAPVPAPYAGQLAAAGVGVYRCDFTAFRFPPELEWSLAFYKLCALDWVLHNTSFDRYLMVDADTFTQSPLTDLWREADEAVLLYQVEHPASQPMAAAISRNCDALAPDGAPHCLTHFGGELVCGSAARLGAFMALCRGVYDEMNAVGLLPHEGDEAILCIAAYRALQRGQPVRAANAYICRYWLGGRYYFVSTNYRLTPVCILHLPGQGKARQLRLIYRFYARRGRLPSNKTVWRWCAFPAARPPLLKTVWVRLLAALGR